MAQDPPSVPFKLFRSFKIPKGAVEEYFRAASDYHPQKGDIFLASFPKCGTTWVQQLLYLLHSKGVPASGGYAEIVSKMPFIEQDGPQVTGDAIALKYHLPFRLMPFSPEAKYIYVARNPKDACVSYYHFLKGLPGYQIESFDLYFEAFLAGHLPHGCIVDHVLEWHQQRCLSNVLFLTYEDLKLHPSREVKKIAEFLDIPIDESILQKILHHSNFDSMQEMMEKSHVFWENYLLGTTRLGPAAELHLPKMLRKGVVGDWKDHFSPEQSKRMNALFRHKTEGTDMENLWKEHMTDI